MNGDLAKAGAACPTPVAKQEDSVNIGPQWCAPEVAEQFRGYALDPMNYQSKMQYIRISEGVLTSKDKYAQFNLVSADAAAQPVRWGSLAAVTGGYEKYGITPGAADLATISDQFGTNVKRVQGFSEFSALKPIIVTQIRVISSSATQISKSWTYNTINPDGVVTQSGINIAATRAKSDQATDLTVAYGVWILNGNHFLQTSIEAGNTVDFIFEVSGIQNVGAFVQM